MKVPKCHIHDLCACRPRSRRQRCLTDLPLPQLATPEEAAEYLGISPYTVRQRLKSGELAGRKHGARWLIRVADLASYVEPNNAN